MLTQSEVKHLLSYDNETGMFFWKLAKSASIKAGDVAGAIDAYGYRVIRIGGRNYKAHRLAWLYSYGEWPKNDLDHRNGAKDDNRIVNLREATARENHLRRPLISIMASSQMSHKRANPVGRPTAFKPEFIEQAEKLCMLGATDYELADFFQVNVVTIHRWRLNNEKFCKAVIAGKEAADERVVRSLYNRAVGYSFESEKVFQFQGEIVRTGTVEHVPPDTGAAMNWLKNRRGDEWRDKVEQQHSGPDGKPLNFAPTIIFTGAPADTSPPETVEGAAHKRD